MTSKNEIYKTLFLQAKSIAENEKDEIARMANISALVHEKFHFLWTGFYRVVVEMLVLGPFQGSIACSRIAYGRGVCGTAWQQKQTIIVDDVEQFPNHIVCNSAARSEIVVPVFKNNEIVAVFDIDSENLANFDKIDKEWLEKITLLLM